MKGIILAGGSGTRLYPITEGVSKQLLPIYDKPMIYYPLSMLLLAGIRDILIITTPQDKDNFKNMLGDGKKYGISIEYVVQEKPEGLPQAFILGESFIENDSVCLVLGDNIFWGQGLTTLLKKSSKIRTGAEIYAYSVKDPENFGVINFKDEKIASIEEKPKKPKSDLAITGLYFFDNNVIKHAKTLKPSARGELEITDLIKKYLKKDQIKVNSLGRGYAWLDAGTHENLLEASKFIETLEKRQGYKIAVIEEICFRNGWLTKEQLVQLSKKYLQNNYGRYLNHVAKNANQ